MVCSKRGERIIFYGRKDQQHASRQLHLPATSEGFIKVSDDVANVVMLWVLLSISSWFSPSLPGYSCSSKYPWSRLLISAASRPVDLIAGSVRMKSGTMVLQLSPPCLEK